MENLRFDQQRTLALAVPCTYCGSRPGQECRTGRSRVPIQHQPAHYVRIWASRLLASKRPAKSSPNPLTVTDPSRNYGTRGWFTAHNSGRCGVCWRHYQAGTRVRALSAYNLRAECCPVTLKGETR